MILTKITETEKVNIDKRIIRLIFSPIIKFLFLLAVFDIVPCSINISANFSAEISSSVHFPLIILAKNSLYSLLES